MKGDGDVLRLAVVLDGGDHDVEEFCLLGKRHRAPHTVERFDGPDYLVLVDQAIGVQFNLPGQGSQRSANTLHLPECRWRRLLA